MKTAQKSIVNAKVQPVRFPELAAEMAVRLPGGVDLPAGQLLVEAAGTAARNEVQTLTVTATGGTATLTLTGFGTTPALAYNANAAALQTAVDNLIGSGNCTVAGTGPFTFTFANEFGSRDVELLTVNGTALTGGSWAMAETTKGSVGKVGGYSAYTGSGAAKAVLGYATKTDARGAVIDEFGNTNLLTAQAWRKGDFLASDLTGLDAAALTTGSGKFELIDGSAITDTGAVVRL